MSKKETYMLLTFTQLVLINEHMTCKTLCSPLLILSADPYLLGKCSTFELSHQFVPCLEAHVLNHSNREVEAGSLQVRGLLDLHRAFTDSQGIHG